MSLKDLSPSEYAPLSELIDQALDLTGDARAAWLADLGRRDARAAALLAALLASKRQADSDAFLENDPLSELAPPREPDSEEALIGKTVGPYRTLSLIGRGGMGSVWLAERVDGLFARRIALKLLHPALMDSAITERFAREREILASLNHPNIARLLDAGFASDGQPYLALEHVEGRPLDVYCDMRRLTVRARLEQFLRVLEAVQYAHARLVLHRDLKPSNILVSEDGEVHLLDFGIAKLLTEGEAKQTELTRFAGRALTMNYAAPEQLAGAPLTTAADVYSLGVALYELLTGCSPYRLKRATPGALEEAILEIDPLPPSRLALSEAAAQSRGTTGRKLMRALKGDLDTIVLKALQKSARNRYSTAAAFAEDIERHLRGEVVLAQADSLGYRGLKFARRHRVGIAVAGALVLTLAAGLVTSSYEATVAAEQRDLAVQAQLRSLTQTAAAHLREGDVPGAMAIILEVLPAQTLHRPYAPEALGVFHEARAGDAQLFALVDHSARLRSAVFSPDGERIATGADDATVRIWDAALGQPLLRLEGHTAQVRGVAFSADGRRLLSASYDATARIWDSATGRELLRLSGHGAGVSAAAFSPDGGRVATMSLDHTARIWDGATGRELQRFTHADAVDAGAFSPDGRYLLTGSYDRAAHLWDIATGRELRRLEGHTDRVSSVAFSAEGAHIVTGSFDHTARVWDAATGRPLVVLRGHAALVSSVAFSPDGARVLTGSADRSARLWDAATGIELARFAGDSDQVDSAAFSPDGKRIVLACQDHTARVWDAELSHETTRLVGHAARVSSAAFSPDGQRIVTSSYDRTARLWDALSSQPLRVLSGHTEWVTLANFSPDGTRVVTASYDSTARIWDAATGGPLLLLKGHGAGVDWATFSPDGRRILTASRDKTARIWDALTGQELVRLSGHSDRVPEAEFSADGRRVVTSSYDRTARIWDAATGRTMALLSGHTDRLTTAAFSPDGARVVTSSVDGTARIWDAATGHEILTLRGYLHPDTRVDSAVFSADGRRILTGASDGTARIWDAATGEQLGLVARHPDLIESAVFAPDGRILTASDDGTARVWDARTAALDVQISAASAAQFDALSSRERFELGLTETSDPHRWMHASKCDESAGAYYDPDRRARGVAQEALAADLALAACAEVPTRGSERARQLYERGRAYWASGDRASARRDLQAALAEHYPSAAVDLGMLLASAGGTASGLVALYEEAWKEHVTIAGFKLGELYEHGARGPDARSGELLAPDGVRAWSWYEKAAAAGEPNALARLAQRSWERSYAATDEAQRQASLLESFVYYARAAARAEREDWPDAVWRAWRYRRASAARLLVHAGRVQQVAELYDRVQGEARSSQTPWQRLQRLLMPSAR